MKIRNLLNAGILWIFFGVFMLGSVGVSGQLVIACYEIEESESGYGTSLYSDVMKDTLCSLVSIVDEMDENNDTFKVVSYDLASVDKYKNPIDIESKIASIKTEVEDKYSEYIAVIKQFKDEDVVGITVFLKLDTSATAFKSLEIFDIDAIASSVESTMNSYVNGIASVNVAELKGLVKFNEYMKEIQVGSFDINPFEELGFVNFPVKQGYTYEVLSSDISDPHVHDYSGIKINGSKYLRDNVVESIKNTVGDLTIGVIITSNNMHNYNASLRNARNDFAHRDEKVVVWMHLIIEGDSIRMLKLSKSNNLTENEVELALTELWYEEAKSYIESFSKTEMALKYYPFLSGKVYERNLQKIKYRETYDNPPYDCSEYTCKSLSTWRCWCCVLTEDERNDNPGSFLPYARNTMYQHAIISGILDGIIETGVFVGKIGGFVWTGIEIDFLSPYSISGQLLYSIVPASMGHDMFNRWLEDVLYMKNTAKMIKEIFTKDFLEGVAHAVKEGVEELAFKEGTTMQGYTLGKTIVLIALGNGVLKAGRLVVKISKGSLNVAKDLFKNPASIKGLMKTAELQLKEGATETFNLLKLSIGGRRIFKKIYGADKKIEFKLYEGKTRVHQLVVDGEADLYKAKPGTEAYKEVNQLETLGEYNNAKTIHLHKTAGNEDIPGIDGVYIRDYEQIPITLKKMEDATESLNTLDKHLKEAADALFNAKSNPTLGGMSLEEAELMITGKGFTKVDIARRIKGLRNLSSRQRAFKKYFIEASDGKGWFDGENWLD